MPLLKQTPGLLDALRGEMTPKFLATRSPDGVPNVVPCVTMLPAKDQPDTLFFGNFLLRKSIKNLKQDTRIGVLVITAEVAHEGIEQAKDYMAEAMKTGNLKDMIANLTGKGTS